MGEWVSIAELLERASAGEQEPQAWEATVPERVSVVQAEGQRRRREREAAEAEA